MEVYINDPLNLSGWAFKFSATNSYCVSGPSAVWLCMLLSLVLERISVICRLCRKNEADVQPSGEPYKTCFVCREKNNARRRVSSSEENKVKNRKRTTGCRQKWIEAGLCRDCGGERGDSTSKRCQSCIIKQIAGCNLGNRSRWKELVELLERQQYLCVYSGRTLVVGVNASLDHRVAITSGGTHDLSNLQWVDKQVNYAKQALSHEAFIALVEEVLSWSVRKNSEGL